MSSQRVQIDIDMTTYSLLQELNLTVSITNSNIRRNSAVFCELECNNPSIVSLPPKFKYVFENSNKTREIEQSGHVVIVIEAVWGPRLCVLYKMAAD
jgi:hypothetical protein